jgi:hypothetical protein
MYATQGSSSDIARFSHNYQVGLVERGFNEEQALEFVTASGASEAPLVSSTTS